VTTIVIADSLIHDFVSPLPEFSSLKVSVGPLEISRTMGEGAGYGRGPLPTFLRAAKEAGAHLVFVRDLHDADDPRQQPELLRYGPHAVRGTEGAAFVPWAAEMLDGVHVIETDTLSLPTARLHEALHAILGRDVLALEAEDRDEITFVVCGFHTEVRVLSIAFKLRNDYRFPRVLVCPHLVGSHDAGAHVQALQTGFPNALVSVVPDLGALARMARVPLPDCAGHGACRILPGEVADALSAEQTAVLQILFLFDGAVTLTPLKGGFSGSLLFIASAEREGRRRAPLVVKIAPHEELHREMIGYERVKDFLAAHVPAMRAPVSVGGLSGVTMSLAAMEGKPRTVQSLFGDGRFLTVFAKGLDLLARDLYAPTRGRRKFSPYQELGLTGGRHVDWLRENMRNILGHADVDGETLSLGEGAVVPNPLHRLGGLLAHVDYLSADTALCHGDLNLANLITDETRAIWIIDWPWCDERPIRFDLAKMENDLKFVVSQDFGKEDRASFLAFERALLSAAVPPEVPPLPFMAEDARFSRIYHAVRLLRERGEALQTDEHRFLHAIGLLRFALHTLSFDARRGRGECALPQLEHALISVALLVEHLRLGPFHQSGKTDRHPSYPPRFPVPPSRLDWGTAWDEYLPPSAPERAPHDGSPPRESLFSPLRYSAEGRPLNPAGRTGLAGRGFFYLWGPNPAVDAVVTRVNPGTGNLEFALVKREDTGQWGLPGRLLRGEETAEEGLARVVGGKLGLTVDCSRATRLTSMLVDDYRNTDHAWIESTAFHFPLAEADDAPLLRAGTRVTDADWLPVNADFARVLFAGHGRIVAACIRRVLVLDLPHLRKRPLEAVLSSLAGE
jgi:ADP-ribose pyrophosphatase